MSKYGFKNVRIKDTSKHELKIVDQQITIAQINRGPADMGNYRRAIQSAEALRNPNRRLYYELIRNVKTDGILDAVINKRIRAVTISPISLEGTDDEKIIGLFQAPWMYDLLHQMMDSLFWGHSLVEPVFNEAAFTDPELEQLFKIRQIPRENVSPEFGIITANANTFSSVGIPFREEPYEPHLFEFGEARSLGMYMNLIPYVLYKRNNWADFAQYNELFGMPLRTYEYDPHQPETRKELEKQAKTAGTAPYVIVPRGTNVEHHSVSTTAGNGGYKDFNSIMNQEMTISVLGQTLTTGADGKGSYALGEVHKDVEESINLEDKVWCEYQLNWNVKRKLINTFGLSQLRGTRFKFDDTIKLTPQEKKDILVGLNAITPIDQQYIRDEFNLPDPDAESIRIWESRKPQGNVMLSHEPGKPMSLLLSEYWGELPRLSGSVTLAYEDDIRDEAERLIAAIHAGQLSRRQVPERLATLVYQQLDEAVGTGYGALTRSVDAEMISALKDNVFQFSAAKEYQFIQEAFSMLTLPDGSVKPFALFRDEVLQVHQNYNVNWLQSEYQAATANAQLASRWQDIQANKSASPLLRFRAVLDDRSRHKKYNGIIRPVDDPIWDWLMPILDWGCRCTVNATSAGELTPDEGLPALQEVRPAFRFNPGKEKMVFSKAHPYFRVTGSAVKDMQNNWGLSRPDANG